MSEKHCKFCERSVEEIAKSSFGMAHTATNVHGNTICWECVESAYELMKDHAELLKANAEEVRKELEAGTPYEGDGCDCPSCRLAARMEASGFISPIAEQTKH